MRLSFFTGPNRAARWTLVAQDEQRVLIRRIDGSPAPRYDLDRDVELIWEDPDGEVVGLARGRIVGSSETGTEVEVLAADRNVLLRMGVAPPQNRSGEAPANLDAAVRTIRRVLQADLGPRIQQWMEMAQQVLEQGQDDESFATLSMPRRLASQRIAACKADVLRGFAQRIETLVFGGSKPTPVGTSSLRLVDDDEMQVWLVRSEASRGLERQTRSTWHALLPVLKSIDDLSDALRMESLEVESVLDALLHASKSAGLESSLQCYLLRLSHRGDAIDLSSFYLQVHRELQRIGFSVPDAPPPAAPPMRQEAMRQPQRATPHPEPAPGSEPRYAPSARTSERREPAATDTPQRQAADERLSAASAQMMEAARRLIGTYGSVLGPQHQAPNGTSIGAEQADAPRTDSALADSALPPTDMLDDDGVQDLLRRLIERRHDSQPDWAKAVDQELGNELRERRGVSLQQGQALQLVSRLQTAVESDPLLSKPLMQWSRSLLPSVLGTELRAGGVAKHAPALRKLFGQLEFASALGAERDDPQTLSLLKDVESIVRSLAEQQLLGEEQIEDVSRHLDLLTQRQQRAGAAIEERVIDACKGQYKLVDARRRVDRELAMVFFGRKVPEALLEILDQRLKPVMVLRCLRQGQQSDAFQSILRGLEKLDVGLRAVEESDAQADFEPHLEWLETLFVEQPTELAALRPQLDALEQAVKGPVEDWVDFPPLAPPTAASPTGDARTDKQRLEMRKQLALLQAGEWLEFQTADGNSRLLKLAWHAPERDRFVFVGRLGNKAEDLTDQELLEALSSERCRVIEGGELDVIERAWRRMVEGMHNELAEVALHDGGTGLLQRREVERRLSAWIGASERGGLGLLWISVDHLHVINEAHGMTAGDSVLARVADLVRALLAQHEVRDGYAGRMAGNEFIVVLPDAPLEEVRRTGETLLEHVGQLDLRHDGQPLRVSSSIGVCTIDESCVSLGALIGDAQRACRAAKDAGRSRVYVSEPDDARIRQMRQSVEWVGRVEQALEEQKLVLFGQRAQSLSAHAQESPDYVEVLLRMRSDDGFASPEHFIIAAERYGQIHAVDRFVLHELTQQLAKHASTLPYRVAMNISGRNIVDRAFIDEVIGTLREGNLPEGSFSIELTETAAVQHIAEAAESMKRLRDAGVTLVLDDFGSGWSSYQYLRRLPFDIVKVDGAFIRDIATVEEDLALARSINEIAHMLGKHTVAEHVENEATLELVRDIGFDYAQGFIAARPKPLSELLDAIGPESP